MVSRILVVFSTVVVVVSRGFVMVSSVFSRAISRLKTYLKCSQTM